MSLRIESVAAISFACLSFVKNSGQPPSVFYAAALADPERDLVAYGFESAKGAWLLRRALSPRAAQTVLAELARHGIASRPLGDPGAAATVLLFRASALPKRPGDQTLIG